ncbi:MAG: DUF1614 domain-containing protein [Thermanaeromonas sp.]|uniref:DUF1614 domain-containing protein n=1 Tax=Thermanaeromonas sp. TaxID=2003697 RepID=UPI00243DE7F7|nr:DUF1614 domain-containing protein [Thermanaeromonas sp.]MCG0278012.1 DUF1614 domain-containing protein [Thermanaeromonas sp.]
MAGYPLGVLALVAVFLLIYFGLAQRVLDRLYLNDKAALALILASILGSFINIPLSRGPITVSVNVGGGLIPLGLAVYVLYRAGTRKEVARALAAAVVTAAVIFGINSWLTRGREPWDFAWNVLDPLYYYPLVAGITAYLVGRSRRAAFVAAILGVLALDIIDYLVLAFSGTRGTVAIGGAGAMDVSLLAGIVAVLLAELIGEGRERLQGGPEVEGRPRSLLEKLRLSPAKKVLPLDKKDGENRG